MNGWNEPDPVKQAVFRRTNHGGYVENYETREVELPDGGKEWQLLKKNKKAGDDNLKIALPMLKVFDVIHHAHSCSGHLKVTPTWTKVKKNFSNVTQDHVKTSLAYAECATALIQPLNLSRVPASQSFPNSSGIDSKPISLTCEQERKRILRG